jgi:hypothetical protein
MNKLRLPHGIMLFGSTAHGSGIPLSVNGYYIFAIIPVVIIVIIWISIPAISSPSSPSPPSSEKKEAGYKADKEYE